MGLLDTHATKVQRQPTVREHQPALAKQTKNYFPTQIMSADGTSTAGVSTAIATLHRFVGTLGQATRPANDRHVSTPRPEHNGGSIIFFTPELFPTMELGFGKDHARMEHLCRSFADGGEAKSAVGRQQGRFRCVLPILRTYGPRRFTRRICSGHKKALGTKRLLLSLSKDCHPAEDLSWNWF
jgi:hypothetical protein